MTSDAPRDIDGQPIPIGAVVEDTRPRWAGRYGRVTGTIPDGGDNPDAVVTVGDPTRTSGMHSERRVIASRVRVVAGPTAPMLMTVRTSPVSPDTVWHVVDDETAPTFRRRPRCTAEQTQPDTAVAFAYDGEPRATAGARCPACHSDADASASARGGMPA